MYLIDSCGWLEWFTNGELADDYRKYLIKNDRLLVPTIVLYEVYKVLKREAGEEKALLAFGHMKNTEVVDFDENLSLRAADLALLHNLAMADAIVYATALHYNSKLITSDGDLKDLAQVTFIPK